MSNANAAAVAEPTTRTGIYRLAEVEKTPTPSGAKGNWYRYVIEGGYAPVTGTKPGTQKQVVAYASELTKELNARQTSGGGSPGTPRGKRNQLILK